MDSSNSPPPSNNSREEVLQESFASSVDEGISILHLNDDCLFEILSFLKFRELLVMETVCKRFKEVAHMIYRTSHNLNFSGIFNDSPNANTSLEEATEIARKVGHHTYNLSIQSSLLIRGFPVNPEIPEFVHMYCKNVRIIFVNGFHFNEDSITKLAVTFKKVYSATLKDNNLTEDKLKALFQLHKLTYLKLCDSNNIYGDFLTGLTNIRRLTLGWCSNIDPLLFIKFCEDHPNLQDLDIVDCRWIDRTCLRKIAENLRNLKAISISNSYLNVTSQDYVVLADMPKIKELTVRRSFYVRHGDPTNIDLMLQRFSIHDQLEYLDIECLEITTNTENALAKFTKIKELNLSTADNCKDTTLDCLTCTSTLEELYAIGTNITSQGIERLIARCPAIGHINVCGSNNVNYRCIPLILPHLRKRSHMLEIYVRRTAFPKIICKKKYVGNNSSRLKITYAAEGSDDESEEDGEYSEE